MNQRRLHLFFALFAAFLTMLGTARAAAEPSAAFSRRAIVVTDLSLSVAFYHDVFGFEPQGSFEITDLAALDAITQLDHVNLRGEMIKDKDGVVFELVQFLRPAGSGSRDPSSMAALGLSHLAFRVASLDEARKKVLAAGGRALDQTRVKAGNDDDALEAMFVSDPNGVRIELSASPGATEHFLWNAIHVSNLKRSVAFYRALGFVGAERFDVSQPQGWLAKLTEIKDIRMVSQIIRDSNGNAIELMDLHDGSARNSKPRRYNQWGLSNLAFDVADRDMVGKALQQRGGRMIAGTRIAIGKQLQWHGVDPDGVRFELTQTGK